MSKYDQKKSPIKMLNSSPALKSFQTPAKYLSQRNDTIYQEEYYKQKCDRLERQNKQLKEHVRIVQAQNKQLKTQIQYYREQPQQHATQSRLDYQHHRDLSTVSFRDQKFLQYDESKLQQIERLLKQIRLLKNNHQVQINQYKTQQKRLNKKVLQLEDNLHKTQLQWQSKCQSAELSIQQKNKLLEKEVKQLRKSVITYMQQRDQNQNSLQSLKKQIQLLNQRIQQLVQRQKNLLEENTQLSQTIKQKDTQNQNVFKKLRQNQQNEDKVDQTSQNIKDYIYQYGLNSRRNDKIRQSNFSIHTFNGNRHVPAQQAFQVSQSLKSEIYRLQKLLENQQIHHQKEINDLNFLIERGQKQIKQKETDLVSLLTKVKPLLLEKHKLTTVKENIHPDETKKVSFQETKQTIGKNAFGLRMLQLYLKKYKMQAF